MNFSSEEEDMPMPDLVGLVSDLESGPEARAVKMTASPTLSHPKIAASQAKLAASAVDEPKPAKKVVAVKKVAVAKKVAAAKKVVKKATDVAQKAKKAEHPKVLEMVCTAIKDIKDRNGSSLKAIVKKIDELYEGVDTEKLYSHIKRAIKTGVENEVLIQSKGTGVSGSFKVAKKAKKEEPKVKKSPKKTSPVKKKVETKAAAKSAVKKKSPVKKSVEKSPVKKTTVKKKTPVKKAKTQKTDDRKSPAKVKKTVAKKSPVKKSKLKVTEKSTPIRRPESKLKQPPSAQKLAAKRQPRKPKVKK